QAGEKVYLSKNIGSISAGREAIVKEVDISDNRLTIEHTFKDKVFTETVDLSTQGNSLNLFKDMKTDLGIGDQIIMKKNDTKLGLKNGQIGKITAIREDEITVKLDKDEKTFSIDKYKYIAHAYAITDFASQGKTTDKVIAVANSQAASFNDFYTQITRAKHEAHIITDDIEELKTRAARDSQKLNASELLRKLGKQKADSVLKEELQQRTRGREQVIADPQRDTAELKENRIKIETKEEEISKQNQNHEPTQKEEGQNVSCSETSQIHRRRAR
ncbi:MAG: hypothetical protein QG617_1602, partial [Campylobacterota bacterium]|nr:hypothetical protein [Campylobacterota bacterium]